MMIRDDVEALIGATAEIDELDGAFALNFVDVVSLDGLAGSPVIPDAGSYAVYYRDTENGGWKQAELAIDAVWTGGTGLSDGQQAGVRFFGNALAVKVVPTGVSVAAAYRVEVRRNRLTESAARRTDTAEAIWLIRDGVLTGSADYTSADARNLFDSAGLLDIDGAPAETARRTFLGGDAYFWVDGSVTNSLLHNRDLDDAVWSNNATVAKNAAGLDGVADSGHTLTDNNASSILGIAQTVSISNDSNTHRAVFPISKEITGFCGVALTMSGGTVVRSNWTFNISTGTLTARSTNSGTVSAIAIELENYWVVIATATNNSSGNTSLSYNVYPAVASSDTGTWDSSATGSCIYDMGGVFLNQQAPLHVFETEGSAVSVDAEDASLTLGSWFNNAAFSVFCDFWTPNTPAAFASIFELFTDSNNFVRVRTTNDSATLQINIQDGGATQFIDTSGTVTEGTLQKVAIAITENDMALYLNGSQIATTSSATVPSLTTLHPGNQTGSSNHGYLGINKLTIEPRRVSNADLASRTSL